MQKKLIKRVLVITSLLFYVFFTIYTLKVKVKELDSVSIGIETIIILIFSFYSFYEMLNDPTITFINNDYRFWIIIGMVVYLAGTFFIYIYANTVTTKELLKFLFLTYIFYIIKDIFFAVGIVVHSQKKPEKESSLPYLDFK
jgi:hypothetical protein